MPITFDGLDLAANSATGGRPKSSTDQGTLSGCGSDRRLDLKTFVDSKNPKSTQQLAVVVAYYYRFEASPNDRKDTINKNDLNDAIRLTGRRRTPRPDTVLSNSFSAGYFDRPGEAGQYAINAVGENLVAMALPGDNGKVIRKPKKKSKRVAAVKKKASSKSRSTSPRSAKKKSEK
jgi:hypothetical protein